MRKGVNRLGMGIREGYYSGVVLVVNSYCPFLPGNQPLCFSLGFPEVDQQFKAWTSKMVACVNLGGFKII